jgi:hypothetical protein
MVMLCFGWWRALDVLAFFFILVGALFRLRLSRGRAKVGLGCRRFAWHCC